MKKKAIEVYVEKAADGSFWGTTQNIPGSVTATGTSLSSSKKEMDRAYEDYLETAQGEDWAKKLKGFEGFSYQFDIRSVFKLLPELKVSAIAKKANINESLMRQYVSGSANASEKRAKEIEKAIHELGRDLLLVSL